MIIIENFFTIKCNFKFKIGLEDLELYLQIKTCIGNFNYLIFTLQFL